MLPGSTIASSLAPLPICLYGSIGKLALVTVRCQVIYFHGGNLAIALAPHYSIVVAARMSQSFVDISMVAVTALGSIAGCSMGVDAK